MKKLRNSWLDRVKVEKTTNFPVGFLNSINYFIGFSDSNPTNKRGAIGVILNSGIRSDSECEEVAELKQGEAE